MAFSVQNTMLSTKTNMVSNHTELTLWPGAGWEDQISNVIKKEAKGSKQDAET